MTRINTNSAKNGIKDRPNSVLQGNRSGHHNSELKTERHRHIIEKYVKHEPH